MEIGTPLGILVSLAALLIALIMDGGHLSSLWTPSSFVLIVGATLGMTMTHFEFRTFAKLPGQIVRAFFPGRQDPRQWLQKLVEMADRARREGLLALEGEAANVDHPLMARGLRMVVDGVDPQQVRRTLETQLEMETQHREELANVLEQAGGYSPTVGIIGTVMGLVHVLSNLQEVDKLGPLIAVAFLATFYGIFFANVFWLPLAGKLKQLAAREARTGRMIIEGLLGLQAGQGPQALRETLEAFLAEPSQPRKAGKGAGRDQ